MSEPKYQKLMEVVQEMVRRGIAEDRHIAELCSLAYKNGVLAGLEEALVQVRHPTMEKEA